MMAPMTKTPGKICVLRLSAVGDVCHAVATVQALQQHLPDSAITWVVGKTEAGLVCDLPGINVVVYDKQRGWAGMREVRRQTRAGFDVLLHMQLSFRANLLAAMIPAREKWGFPRTLSKELHSLVVNRRVGMPARPHVLEAFQHFAYAVGVPPFEPRWDIPVPAADRAWVTAQLNGSSHYVVIAPSASNPERNWLADRYAALAEHAAAKGFQVVLTGSPAAREIEFSAAIARAARASVIDLTGKSSLKQLLAVVADAAVVVAPDSGTAHLAVTQGTPVVGLYAHSNPRRTGPYRGSHLTLDAYTPALANLRGQTPDTVRWGTRLKGAELMSAITLTEVLARFDLALEESAT
jgi:heptosyltransferase I